MVFSKTEGAGLVRRTLPNDKERKLAVIGWKFPPFLVCDGGEWKERREVAGKLLTIKSNVLDKCARKIAFKLWLCLFCLI